MQLYIAEKPSMATEIAKCLPGPLSKKDGYIETGAGVVTWAYGHILQQADPQEYDEKYKVWSMETLPIIPENWKLIVTQSCKKQFNVIQDLINKTSEIIHAGDPDREGQLLIDEILEYIGNKKRVRRILLNALDEKSIKRALADLRDNKDFYNLQQSALARSRADWLIGMNLSRAYTLAARKAGHEVTLPIGRVKTPTLALVVRREEEIKNFKAITYYTIKAKFLHTNGQFEATWHPKENQPGMDNEDRLIEKSIASELAKKLNDASNIPALIADVETTQKKEPNRLPFSLSALQVEAGKKYGYDPQTVLDIAQNLYEKKLTTYPRSDCDYLPENQLEDAGNILANLTAIKHSDLNKWASGANVSIKSRAWNDGKITAHHAIIPTETVCKIEELPEKEQNVYFLVARAYTAQFYPVHVYDHTKVSVTYADEEFAASGKVIIEDGWKSLYRTTADKPEETEEEETKELPMMQKGDAAEFQDASMTEKKTQPPKRFTTSTLLQAMKEIHKYVKNKEMQKQLKEVSGIGTEATRAGIIKDIVDKGFLREEKKYLVPTDQAYLLVSVLPDEMTYPDATAEWEMTFEKMVDGTIKLNDFIDRQKIFVTNLCQKAGSTSIQGAQGQTCPKCGNGILRSRKGPNGTFWGCSQYPDCKATYPDKAGKPDLEPPKEYICPQCCDGKLRSLNGANGKFWACNRYPDCKATFPDYRGKPQMITCPTCKKGILRKHKGKKGDFWGCGNYPECKSTFEDEKGKPKISKENK